MDQSIPMSKRLDTGTTIASTSDRGLGRESGLVEVECGRGEGDIDWGSPVARRTTSVHP